MGYNKKIKAISMLLIMGLMMMHNAFPHTHHQCEFERCVLAVDFDHHHEQEHGLHHNNHSVDDEENSLLDFLFQNHSHSTHSHQYTPVPVEYRLINILCL